MAGSGRCAFIWRNSGLDEVIAADDSAAADSDSTYGRMPRRLQMNASRQRNRATRRGRPGTLQFQQGECQEGTLRMFFFEKKNQKTFVYWLSLSKNGRRYWCGCFCPKVFWFFFCNYLGEEGKRQQGRARMFFFEKKNQKTFVYWLSLKLTPGVIGADVN